MPAANDINVFEANRARFAERSTRVAQAGGGSGSGDGGGGEFGRRLAALERAHDRVDGKLDDLIRGAHEARLAAETRLATIDGKLAVLDAKLDTKAQAADMAFLRGRLEDMPTKWFVATSVIAAFVGAVGALSAVLVFLERIRTLLGAH